MRYRSIDVAHLTPVVPSPQPAPILQWVDVADLVVDDSYQRGLHAGSWAAIRKIAEGFDWSHFGALLVAPVEGGKFALIDGQHRAHAAAICGIASVPCIVSILPVSAQARAFAVVNSTATRVSPLQIYKAALASGEGWALACDRHVAAAGCRLMPNNISYKDRKLGQIFAVATIRAALDRVGGVHAVRVGLQALLTHAQAMGPLSGVQVFQKDVLHPWLTVLVENPAFLDIDLDGFLRRNRLVALLDSSDKLMAHAQYSTMKGPQLRRVALMLRLTEFQGAVAA